MRFGTRRLALCAIVLVSACGPGSNPRTLDVQTFELEYLDPDAAASIIRPYVFTGEMSVGERTLTVREMPEMLTRIGLVLEEFDRPEPSVTLRFQIIEADGAAASDPAIADVEAALRDLFRFEGYTLLAEAVMKSQRGRQVAQSVIGDGDQFKIQANIGPVRRAEDGGTVSLAVHLGTEYGVALATSVNAKFGQTVVLGTGQPNPERGALILTVKAELDDI